MIKPRIDLSAWNIQINTDRLMKDIQSYLMTALQQAEDKLIEIMSQEIDIGPSGRKNWRDDIKKDLHRVYENVTNDAITIGVGLDYAEGTYQHVRAMLTAYGSGSLGGGYPIEIGPKDRMVWDDNLNEVKKPSTADWSRAGVNKQSMALEQPGNDWVNNAMLRMKEHFDSIIGTAFANMPDSIILGAVYTLR